MRTRTIKKQVWLNSRENELLKKKCMKAGLSESSFFRHVINDTQIKEKPDENFYKILNDLRGIAVNINQLARVANTYQYVDDNKYYPLANKVNDMIDDLQKFYLTPTKKENELVYLNVSNCRELSEISCKSNQLTSLDLSNKPKLDYVVCSENHIKELDVKASGRLRYIECEENELKVLDLSNTDNLYNFRVSILPKESLIYITTVETLYLPGNISNLDNHMGRLPDSVTVYVGGVLYRQGKRPQPTAEPTKADKPTAAPSKAATDTAVPTKTATVTAAPTKAANPTTAPKVTVTAVPTKGAKPTAVPTGVKGKKPTAVPTTASGATVTPSEPGTTAAPAATSAVVKTSKDITVNGFIYTISSESKKTLTVKGYKKAKAKVSVAATVKIKKTKYKVTKIADKAFKNNKKLKQVTIGKNIKVIGKEAFSGCSKLKKITVKSKVLKKVGKNAFKGINKKALVTVPKAKQKKLFGKLKTKVKK